MTMYLSNRDIRPTGVEPAEFIDVERVPDEDMRAVPAPAHNAPLRAEPNPRKDGPA